MLYFYVLDLHLDYVAFVRSHDEKVICGKILEKKGLKGFQVYKDVKKYNQLFQTSMHIALPWSNLNFVLVNVF